MEHKTWVTVDKSTWGDGPWQAEPDKEQWADEVTGYACLVKRNRGGALCGYVGVPQGHPWHGKDYDDVGAEVHGGLTYADLCQEGPEGETICHVPAPGEPEPLWWLGFDCAHYMDLSPGMAAELRGLGQDWPMMGETYKSIAYVKAECARLAQQAAASASQPAGTISTVPAGTGSVVALVPPNTPFSQPDMPAE
jgi:hypothetical protein